METMTKRIVAVGSAATLAVIGTWLGFELGQQSMRYETKVAGEGLYKIDRQTGAIEFCYGVTCRVANTTGVPDSKDARVKELTDLWEKRGIENRKRYEFLLMLEEGFVTPDGNWTAKARIAYQAETQRNTLERFNWGSSKAEQIRDGKLASFGASTFDLPNVEADK